MCYEMSGWFRKARAPEQRRKEVPTEKAVKPETATPVAPKVATPEKRTAEKEKIPA